MGFDRAVRLQPFALAYNPADFLRTLALPEASKHRTLRTLRETFGAVIPAPNQAIREMSV